MSRWYEDVLGAVGFMGTPEPHYLASERRHASLLMVADLCIEPMAPEAPADPSTPVGRFLTRFGPHLYAVAFQVDDLVGLGRRLLRRGVTIGLPGGARAAELPDDVGYFVPSPRDVSGAMVELLHADLPGDQRRRDDWPAVLEGCADQPGDTFNAPLFFRTG